MNQKTITQSMLRHHERVFAEHGATPKGVDWGVREADTILRYEKMLEVLPPRKNGERVPRILDVGCGYGGLLDHMLAHGISADYTGIDICAPMIETAKAKHPEADFRHCDIFETRDIGEFDYVICNGIMTQKLEATIPEMTKFVHSLVRILFEVAREGVAFNLMSNRVNFMAENLFYQSPVEMLSWCMNELTPNVRLDHAYPLYEYTLYLYKNGLVR